VRLLHNRNTCSTAVIFNSCKAAAAGVLEILLPLLLFLLSSSCAVLLVHTKSPCTSSTLYPPRGRPLQEQRCWAPLQKAARQLPPGALVQQPLLQSGGEHADQTWQEAVPAAMGCTASR
jgi:hypothetical protein